MGEFPPIEAKVEVQGRTADELRQAAGERFDQLFGPGLWAATAGQAEPQLIRMSDGVVEIWTGQFTALSRVEPESASEDQRKLLKLPRPVMGDD